MSQKKQSSAPASPSPSPIDASITLVKQARQPFANTVRLTSVERKRMVKLKRGAHQVIPQIAQIAKAYAVEVPGSSIDEMLTTIQQAQSLEPLLNAVRDFHKTLLDEYLRTQSAAWKTAIATYGMLRSASAANQSIHTELESVQKWFRIGPRKKSTAQPTTSAPPPATPAPADAHASQGNGNAANGAEPTATTAAPPTAG